MYSVLGQYFNALEAFECRIDQFTKKNMEFNQLIMVHNDLMHNINTRSTMKKRLLEAVDPRMYTKTAA